LWFWGGWKKGKHVGGGVKNKKQIEKEKGGDSQAMEDQKGLGGKKIGFKTGWGWGGGEVEKLGKTDTLGVGTKGRSPEKGKGTKGWINK